MCSLALAQDSTQESAESRGNGDDSTEVRFARDVLPILSNKCFLCHGPDEGSRQADLRLDLKDHAFDAGVIDTGDAEASELVRRVTSDDEFESMPPPDSGIQPLTKSELRTIKRWINDGAEWETHWSFEPPKKSILPSVKQKKWVKNPIDTFVLAQLENKGIRPSPAADKETLLRRAALLITGLPANTELAQTFLDDSSDDAYENLVDGLLASSAYGERMAAVWMDVARYSDSDGFQQDEPRTNWPWRDWVITAYNANKPFDEFTIEQFAGDLLPDATDQQILATCFHRNHMTNSEGGRDPAESRVDYVMDRVNTVGTVWLGLTLGCAQCHTHKYDPITQKEYYQLSAYFNSIDENGRAGKAAKPYLKLPLADPELHLAQPRAQIAKRESELKKIEDDARSTFDDWLEEQVKNSDTLLNSVANADWKPFAISDTRTKDKSVKFNSEKDNVWFVKKGSPDNVTYTLTGAVNHSAIGSVRVEALPHKSHTSGGLARSNSGNFVLTDVVVNILRSGKDSETKRVPVKLVSAWSDYEQPGHSVERAIDPNLDTGWAVLNDDMKKPRTAVFQLAEPIELADDDKLEVQLVHFSHHPKHNIGRFRISVSPRVDAAHETELTRLLKSKNDTKEYSNSTRTRFLDYRLASDGRIGLKRHFLAQANKKYKAAESKNSVSVMVLKELKKQRKSFVLERGVWDAHGEEVFSSTPTAIKPFAETNGDEKATGPQTRMDLAKWIVDRRNPLTARVTVNRYWQMYFGAGLVRTPEDFGLQGEYPTHPELLDWLAVEFMDSGWDVKHVLKLIATSATFQQSSRYTESLLKIDPANRMLARGPRFRMPAAMIRDNALVVSGLLSRRIGGPSVKPYQPENVWAASDQGKYPYHVAKGEDLYRRSLYTYWRRNISPPAMFDAAQRRVCEVQVRRTNSPMHALTLLNDTTYLEAARMVAQSILLSDEELAPGNIVNAMYQKVLGRSANQFEVDQMSRRLSGLEKDYAANPDAAKQVLQIGDSAVAEELREQPALLTAATIVASTILNLDETLNVE